MDKRDQNDDIEDLDAFLEEDSTRPNRQLSIDEKQLITKSISNLPRTTDPLKRIDHRITHAFRSIEIARDNRATLRQIINLDEEFSKEFSSETLAWEEIITKLDNTLSTLPARPPVNIEKTSSTEKCELDIAAEVASHIDTFVQKAYAAEQSADTDTQPHEPEIEELVTDTESGHEAGYQDELRRCLEEREARILELESKLEKLKNTPDGAEENLFVNRLFVVSSKDKNLKYPLTKQIMTVGREPENDIHIRSRYISRFHARIVCDADGTVIEDLDSRNGISVNSKRVRRQQLRSGDMIDIGRVQFKYIDLMEGSPGEGSA